MVLPKDSKVLKLHLGTQWVQGKKLYRVHVRVGGDCVCQVLLALCSICSYKPFFSELENSGFRVSSS